VSAGGKERGRPGGRGPGGRGPGGREAIRAPAGGNDGLRQKVMMFVSKNYTEIIIQ
jgi:hypothetical protein